MLKLGRWSSFVAALAILVLLLAEVAAGLTCFETPVCERFWQADFVFRGRIVKLQRGSAEVYGIATLVVEESYRGGRSSIIDVHGWDIESEEGQRYLVYAHRTPDGTVTSSSCFGTTLWAYAKNDLAYIQGLSYRSHGSEIFGEVLRIDRTYGLFPRSAPQPMSGIKVHLGSTKKGKKAWVVQTGESGQFQKKRLDPGKYRVWAELPSDLAGVDFGGSRQPVEVEVVDKGCARVKLEAYLDGRIRGRVQDFAGSPAPGFAVELLLADQKENRPWAYIPQRAGPDGEFEFDGLPAGRFVLRAGPATPIYGSEPQRFFYPGTPHREEAAVFTLGPGERLTAGDLVLPREYTPLWIRGLAVTRDGRPHSGGRVVLTDLDYPGHQVSAETDEQGRFALPGYPGRTYSICTYKLVLGPTGEWKELTHADPVVVTVSGQVPDVRLLVDKPGNCPAVKRRAK